MPSEKVSDGIFYERINNMNRWMIALASVWLGLQIMAGYVAAPFLFKALPKLQAGAIAGELFNVVSYSGLAVWGIIYLMNKKELKKTNINYGTMKLIWALLVALSVNQFLITPVIEAHKNHTENWLLSIIGGSFGAWHGVSSLIYMGCAVLSCLFIGYCIKAK